MPDKTYCYPNSDVLINKLNIRNQADLFEAEKEFIKVFAENYGDLNALHPFREGNGRTQREFARLICMECGVACDLSVTSHEEMLRASKISFDNNQR